MGASRPPAPQSGRHASSEGRKVERQEGGPPLKSQTVDLDLASSEMARLATVDTGPQRRRSAPRTHDHAHGLGLGRPTPEKRLYGPVYAAEIIGQVRGGRPDRAGA